jgi:hypothetical protein
MMGHQAGHRVTVFPQVRGKVIAGCKYLVMGVLEGLNNRTGYRAGHTILSDKCVKEIL